MQVSVFKKGPVSILRVSEKFALGHDEGRLLQKVGELLDAQQQRFVFNLGSVALLDSTGLGEMVACRERIRKRDGSLRVVLSPRGRELFSITRLDRVFEILADEEEALASYIPDAAQRALS